jgi:hypothetical protein
MRAANVATSSQELLAPRPSARADEAGQPGSGLNQKTNGVSTIARIPG